jgi:hypothetical protein
VKLANGDAVSGGRIGVLAVLHNPPGCGEERVDILSGLRFRSERRSER